MNMKNIKAYGTKAADAPLVSLTINRREPRPRDVAIEILYCGVCHSDLHTARNDWGGTSYPVVPGHEIIGSVIQVGSAVSRFKVGDNVGV
ncbi:MAG: alcohol dehydrogenase catalytic domain-containing protein, partial [Bacteroidota bacterium]